MTWLLSIEGTFLYLWRFFWNQWSLYSLKEPLEIPEHKYKYIPDTTTDPHVYGLLRQSGNKRKLAALGARARFLWALNWRQRDLPRPPARINGYWLIPIPHFLRNRLPTPPSWLKWDLSARSVIVADGLHTLRVRVRVDVRIGISHPFAQRQSRSGSPLLGKLINMNADPAIRCSIFSWHIPDTS